MDQEDNVSINKYGTSQSVANLFISPRTDILKISHSYFTKASSFVPHPHEKGIIISKKEQSFEWN